MSTRMIHCTKLDKEAEGLTRPPYPGDLGKRIYTEICTEAWQQWMGQQTMLINEYRLDLTEKKSRDFLKDEMQKFLFEGVEEKPAGYKPTDAA